MTGRTLFIFPGQSRAARLPGLAEGKVPREFFYGYLALQEHGYDVSIADSRRDPDEVAGYLLVRLERIRNGRLNFGFSRQRVRALAADLADSDLALSFTDGFSLSLGLYGREAASPRTALVGGFHGLADLTARTRWGFRGMAHRVIQRALDGLDHVFFFGEPDRRRSIELFDLPAKKASLYRFGIDTRFWKPAAVEEEDVVLAVGSDPKRDYATLVNAPTEVPMRLLTRLPVRPPVGREVELLRGSYHNSPVTDLVLRDMYRRAAIVAVPLHDVWQPTGYSVTLQAMACGRPVILSDIRGLWDREVFEDGVNCLLVPTADRRAMAEAIETLRTDPELRRRIGAAGRRTVETHFPLARMNDDIVALATRFGAAPAEPATTRRSAS